jgi:hypothetical protein
MSEKRQVLISRILLNVRISRAEQCNEDIDENDGSEEVPRVINDQSEWVTETIVWRVEIG